MSTDARIKELRDEWIELNAPSAEACESPIEELFMWAWLLHLDQRGDAETLATYEALWRQGMLIPGSVDDAKSNAWHSHYIGRGYGRQCFIYVFQQVTVDCPKARYRADLAFFCAQEDVARGGKVFLRGVVELDGHDFHERTKTQASRDRARDRAMLSAGWEVLRFTGADVYKDPVDCIVDVVAFIDSRTPEYIARLT